MIIEYQLQGSNIIHKGLFETTGFWVRVEDELDDITNELIGIKIFSMCSFAYYHTDSKKVMDVYDCLLGILTREIDQACIDKVGYMRVLQKEF